jgi:hypothetical protein
MKRGFLAGVVASLALPVVAIAALIGEQELGLSGTPTINVPLIGVDPRDLLRGRYLIGQFDWDWETDQIGGNQRRRPGGLCVVSIDNPKPKVRFIDGWQASDGKPAECHVVIAGTIWPRPRALPQFLPRNLGTSPTNTRFYLPETRATELEALLIDKPGTVTVDLSVKRDGTAAIRRLRVDGQPLGK